MSRIRVVVTAEDIAVSTAQQRPGRSNGSTCPLARGLNAAGFPSAHAARSYWQVDSYDRRLWPLTKRATAFINRFDAHKPVQPATFYLEGPDR